MNGVLFLITPKDYSTLSLMVMRYSYIVFLGEINVHMDSSSKSNVSTATLTSQYKNNIGPEMNIMVYYGRTI